MYNEPNFKLQVIFNGSFPICYRVLTKSLINKIASRLYVYELFTL